MVCQSVAPNFLSSSLGGANALTLHYRDSCQANWSLYLFCSYLMPSHHIAQCADRQDPNRRSWRIAVVTQTWVVGDISRGVVIV